MAQKTLAKVGFMNSLLSTESESIRDSVTIRFPHKQDEHFLHRLATKGRWRRFSITPDTPRRFIHRAASAIQSEDEKKRFWVADVDGRPVAAAGWDVGPHKAGNIAWVRVEPAYRHWWILLMFLYTAIADCHNSGVIKVRLAKTLVDRANLTLLIQSGHIAYHCPTRKKAIYVYPSLYTPWQPVKNWSEIETVLDAAIRQNNYPAL